MKKVFQVLVAAIVIFVIGGLIISFSFDGIVKSSIESSTAEMLGTSVSVEEVDISILDGTGTITGITIQNPEPFSSNHPAVQLQQVSLSIDLTTLLSDVIVIREMRISSPELYFEQRASGNNFNTLNNRMNASSSGGTAVAIDYLLVENGQILLSADVGNGKSAEVGFSRIEIEGIGRDGNNTMEQTIQQVLEPILQKAVKEALEQGLMDQAKDKLQDLLEG